MRDERPFHRRQAASLKIRWPGWRLNSSLEGSDFVGERSLRNHAARKLAGQRVPSQKPLRGVGQRFAGTVESTVIGRDQSIALRQAGGHGHARHARSGGEPSW